jgi:ATP-dependent Clp protease ATP-binding subunit ClpA
MYGVRPLKRVIQNELLNVLAKEMIVGNFSSGSKIEISLLNGQVTCLLKK